MKEKPTNAKVSGPGSYGGDKDNNANDNFQTYKAFVSFSSI